MLVEPAIGDAYGAGFEHTDPSFVAAHNSLREYVQHPAHVGVQPGMYTDDTQMTIAVAEALLSGEPWTPENLAERFVAAFKRDPRDGYARRFQQLLHDVADGAELLARIEPRSDKSGAAMRAGPVGLLPTVADVLHYAAVQARITHDAPAGVEAAQAAALAVHYCHFEHGPAADIAHWIDRQLLAAGGTGGWSEPALTAIAASSSLSEILQRSVAFTGDVDTVATIALAAASGSPHTIRDLPAKLQRELETEPYGQSYLRELDHRLLSWASPPIGSPNANVPGPSVIGLWSTAPLYLGVMEADDVAFLADGTGWFTWSNALVAAEANRFTWHLEEPGVLRVRFLEYIHRMSGQPAKTRRRRATETVRMAALVGRGTDALDNDVTVLTLQDSATRPDRRYALVRRDVRQSDDPVS